MTSEEMWEAIQNRAAKFDGKFVYAVNSTGVFCRPSCPSKRPRRDRVTFFTTNDSAREAGFRACKRCQPENFAPSPIEKAARKLETAPKITLEKLGREVGHAPEHLQKSFQRATGVSPREFGATRQLETLKNGLRDGKSVVEAQNNADFGSARGVYEFAKDGLGMTPATYGKGGKGAKIRFAVAPCFLGWILVAKTEIGVCSVALGDSPEELEADLRREFFAAEIQADNSALKSELEVILAALEGHEPLPQLPLDIRATAFQARVWRELRQIARGKTVSYGELAAQLGDKNAVRAVARACASNPVALVTPCHRVVGKNGELTGFRWGLERKKRLLEHERAG